MDEPHLKAYGLLAEAIYRHAHAMAEHDYERNRRDARYECAPRPIYNNYSMSTFEDVSDALCKLEMMKPLDVTALACAFACALEDVANIAERNWQNGQGFEELLTTFVALFGEFGAGYWGFATDRNKLFEPGEHLRAVLAALAVIGYATVENGRYKWTTKMCPIMSASRANFWPPDEQAG
jgi:hypothetical protein